MISAFTLGVGIWAMHFVGMLAFSLSHAIEYDLFITLISMVPAILASGVALDVAWHGGKRLSIGVRSVLLGAGIGTMHYTGMAAMRLDGFVRYDPSLFALSIFVAVALSYLALRVKSGMVRLKKWHDALVAVIMGGAISGMHYTAMSAAYFVPGDVAAWPPTVFTTNTLAIAVTLTTAFLALGALALAAISRNREMTGQLRDSEERFRSVFEYSKVGMCIQDDGRYLDVNPAFVEMTGYSEEELLRCSVADITHPDDAESGTALRATLLTGAIKHFHREKRYIRKDGSTLWADVTISVGRDDAGKLLSVIGIIQNITERKRTQDEILRLNASLEERVQQLQSQQEELRQSNEELEEKSKLLAEQKVEVEYKNREIEAARLTLEERAEQLALTSRYKSEFLSNMSHELRTPLNSLLILAQLLAENHEHNLSGQQIEYAKTIQGAGKDLLALINDILDLSKIESGTVTLELDDVSFANVGELLERSFRHVAQSRGLGFSVELAPGLPPSLYTDAQRLQQVLKNLLSNAFKFTNKGQVSVRIAAVESGWSVDHAGLNRSETVIGFFVTDTGIGLADDKHKIIFEAFQQADTGTARQYGGTGLGLSISRELAWLLGGELHLAMSSPGQGSTFALYLPLRA